MSAVIGRRLRDVRDLAIRATGRLTGRERGLLAALGLILMAAAAAWAYGWAADERDSYAAAQAELMLARQMRQAAEQGELDAFDRAQLRALSDWSEHGPNIWLARVRIEQKLAAAVAEAGADEAEIEVAEAPEAGLALSLIKAEVSAPFRGDGMVRVLRRISAQDAAFVLSRIEVTEAEPRRFRLTLLVPVELSAPPRDAP